MNGLQILSQIPRCPSSFFDPYKNISENWQVALLDASTVIAIVNFVAAFFTGSALLCAAFLFVTAASGIGALYMRQISVLQGLREAASDLRTQNDRLRETNAELTRNNADFRQNNQNLVATNARLTQQVAELSLHVTQLKESAEKIRVEVIRFQQENQHLHHNVGAFDSSLRIMDQQILSSKALCDQISTHLSSQEQGLGEQLDQLRSYISELRADNRIHEKIQELSALQQQLSQAGAQLHQVQLQYTAERANFQAIHQALVQLKDQFDSVLQDAGNNFRANNQQFQSNISALTSERERIRTLIDRHFHINGNLPG